MTPALLTEASALLYGGGVAGLAHDLGVSRRTVQRWMAGSSPIPGGLAGELAGLVVGRRDTLGALYGALMRSQTAFEASADTAP